MDDDVGVVLARDLLRQCVEGKPFDIRAALNQPLFVPESTPVLRLLEMFRRSNVGTATVLDEFGGVQGLVTLSDIFRDLVGELPGTGGAVSAEPAIVTRPEGGWLVDGAAPVEDLEEELGFARPDDEREHDYRTVGGLVLNHLGHLPRIGEEMELRGFRFEVVDMDGRRIDRLLVTPTRTVPGEGDGSERRRRTRQERPLHRTFPEEGDSEARGERHEVAVEKAHPPGLPAADGFHELGNTAADVQDGSVGGYAGFPGRLGGSAGIRLVS